MGVDQQNNDCPKCNRVNSLRQVKDIIDGNNNHLCSSFCAHCDFTTPNYRKRSSRIEPKLPLHYRQQAAQAYSDEDSTRYRDLFRDLGVCRDFVDDKYNKAFSDIVGYSEMNKKAPTLHLPVMNSWGATVGSLKLTKSNTLWPGKKTALAAVISEAYFSYFVFVVDCPRLALAIKLASVEGGWKNKAGIVIFNPNHEIPPLKLFQDYNHLLVCTNDLKRKKLYEKALPHDSRLISPWLLFSNGLSCPLLQRAMEHSAPIDDDIFDQELTL